MDVGHVDLRQRAESPRARISPPVEPVAIRGIGELGTRRWPEGVSGAERPRDARSGLGQVTDYCWRRVERVRRVPGARPARHGGDHGGSPWGVRGAARSVLSELACRDGTPYLGRGSVERDVAERAPVPLDDVRHHRRVLLVAQRLGSVLRHGRTDVLEERRDRLITPFAAKVRTDQLGSFEVAAEIREVAIGARDPVDLRAGFGLRVGVLRPRSCAGSLGPDRSGKPREDHGKSQDRQDAVVVRE